jgi:hypothetical protein
MSLLGSFYLDGDIIAHDIEQAKYWLLKAKDNNDANAYYYLGTMYDDGKGYPNNYNTAIKNYEKSIELGSKQPYFRLGQIYEYGKGVNANYAKALEYYLKIDPVDLFTNEKLFFFYKYGLGTPIKYDKAIEYANILTYKRNVSSSLYREIAEVYDIGGNGIEKNSFQAFKFYKKAADLNDTLSQIQVAYMYFNGFGTKTNYDSSFKYYAKASITGNSLANYNLGVCYLNGFGVQKSEQYAITKFLSAANKNLPIAMYTIASYNLEGGSIYLPINYNEGRAWLDKAVQSNYPDALYKLATFYETGHFYPYSLEDAKYYYKKAADLGYQPAIDKILKY